MKHGHLVATWRAYPVIIYQWHQSIQLRPAKLRLYMSIWPVPKRMAHFKPSGGCSRRMDRVLEVMSWPSYPLTTFIYRSGYLLISVFVLVIGRYDLVYSTSGWRGTLALTQQLAQMRTNSRNEATETIKQTFEVTERDGISTTLSNHHYIFVQSHSQGPQPQIDDTDMWWCCWKQRETPINHKSTL